jgi:hypothetical protein
MAEYANLFTILALVFVLFWQSRVIRKTEIDRDRIRLDLGGKLYRAQAEIRAADFHRALVLPGSIDHSAVMRHSHEETAMLRERIEALTTKHGSLRAAARVLGVDPSYLLRLRDGSKTNPSDALLRKLKLRRVVTVEFVPYNY